MDLMQELVDVDRRLGAASADELPVDPTLNQLPQQQQQQLVEAEQVRMECFEQAEQRRQRKRDYMRAYRSKGKPLQKSSLTVSKFNDQMTPEHLEEKRRKKREYMRTYREQAGIRRAAEDMVDMESTLMTTTSTEQPVLSDRQTSRPASLTQDAIRQRRHRQNLSDEKKEAIRAKNRERQRQRRVRLEEVE